MSNHDEVLVEKAARVLHERDMYDEWNSPECNQVPDNGGGSCKQDYLDAARAVLDAVADDLRAEALERAAWELRKQARWRFEEHGPHDPRGAALWDAGCHVDPSDGDALGINEERA